MTQEEFDKLYLSDLEKLKFVLDSFGNVGIRAVLDGGGGGGGDMLKSTYDTTNNGVVDDSEKLGGQLPSYYATGGGVATGINTGDQTITLTGDVTGGGTGTFSTTLSNSGVGPGTYTNANVTVDSKGRVTNITSGSSGSGGTVSTTNEVPTGLVNGSNTVYTISNSATNNEIVVTINGLKQLETTDYTLSGTTLTFTTAPFTGALLEVYYTNSTSSAGYQTSTKSADYTLVNTDYVILADTTSSNITLTLPTAVGQSGRSFVLKKVSTNNILTIATTSSQTIDGLLTQYIGVGSRGAITVHGDGTNYFII